LRRRAEEGRDLQALAAELLERYRPSSIGLGSGRAASLFLRGLAPLALERAEITLVASSLQIQLAAEALGLRATPQVPAEVDLVVDGADQVSLRGPMLKGKGGALLREKVLHAASKGVVILVEPQKVVDVLDAPITLEVAPAARLPVLRSLERMGAKASLRLLDKGYPLITENGNLLIEADFGRIEGPEELHERLKRLPGIVEVGLFLRRPDELYALEEGLCRRIA